MKDKYEKPIARVVSLDYLRGIMAVSIMLYHYVSWGAGVVGGEYLLGKLGVYGVSTFYILSGLSLAIVYRNRIKTRRDVLSFVVKRVFRIFPLFWLAVSLGLIIAFAKGHLLGESVGISLYTVFLNYSLLFGFIDPSAYLTTGAWSIGNEMVFYVIFPILFLFSKRFSYIVYAAGILSLVAAIYFAFFLMTPVSSIESQWDSYINPFNQLFLFLSGVILGCNGKRINNLISETGARWGLVVVLLLFYFYPSDGDKIEIVTGFERLFFSLMCILVVLFVYLINFDFGSRISAFLSFLGESCYSIYLLHPLIASPTVFAMTMMGVNKLFAYMVSIIITLIASYFTYVYLEAPMMLKSKVMGNKIKNSEWKVLG